MKMTIIPSDTWGPSMKYKLAVMRFKILAWKYRLKNNMARGKEREKA